MRWFAAAVIAGALVVLAFAVFRARPRRFAPGKLEVRIVDEDGHIVPWVYTLTVDGVDERAGESAQLTLAEGRHRISARLSPAPDSASSEVVRVLVTRDAPSPNPVLELRVGASKPQLALAKLGIAPSTSKPVIPVSTITPERRPLAGGWYSCGEDVMTLDAKGRGECPGSDSIIEIRAGAGDLGGVTWSHLNRGDIFVRRAINFAPRARAIDGRSVQTRGLHLTVNSTNQSVDHWYSSWNVVLPGLEDERAIACFTLDELSACDVIPQGSGLYQPDVVLGLPAEVTFTPTLEGKPVTKWIVYLDRIRTDVTTERVTLPVSPGRHVLVLNADDTSARHELVFQISPEQKLDLGELPLELPPETQ
ncbi:MAG: hypothetical protein ACO1OB_30740 [Archangium sp.]